MMRDLEAIQAIIDAVREATEKERARCLDIVIEASLQVNSPHAQHVLGEVAHKIKEGQR